MAIIEKTCVEVYVYDTLSKMYIVPTPFKKGLMFDTPNTYSELLMMCRDIAMYDYAYIVTIRCCDIEPFDNDWYNGIAIDITQGAYDYPYVSVKQFILHRCWANAYLIG